jgi:cobaltochelatase CobT
VTPARRVAVQREDAMGRALTAAGRALSARRAQDMNWDQALAPDAQPSRRTGERAAPTTITVEEFRRLRGRVDALALHARYHDARIHAAVCPPDAAAAALLAALEQLRVEALGARGMTGVADNLRELLGHDCRARGYHVLQYRRDVPFAAALLLHVRSIVAPQTLPAAAAPVLAAWDAFLDPLTADLRPALVAGIGEQARFASICRDIIDRLAITDAGAVAPGARRPLDAPPLREQDFVAAERERERADATVPFGANRGAAAVSVDGRTPSQRIRAQGDGGGVSDGCAPGFGAGGEGAHGYRVFDPTHDEVTDAMLMRPPQELARLRERLDELLVRHPHLVARLANRLRRCLLAVQRQDWTRDLDEGGLDTSRLARAVIDPNCPLSFRQQRDRHARDTVVSLLIDNSGSMAGRAIETAAVCADILARTLERCGVRSEILGFTTGAWKGGRARERWIALGRPAHPGRLNELQHIIYKPADASWRRARTGLGLMLDPMLLKENVDGEALLWAHQRLLSRPERRRILIVISDGEPADEVTLDANGSDYLQRHLRRVIAWIEARSPVHLVAIGVGHDVARHYRRSLVIDDPGQLGDALAGQLARVLGEDTGSLPARAMPRAAHRRGFHCAE